MAVVGIICEYNPFHNGHRHQFDAVRACCGDDTAVVCLMSGDFVQRGQPAIYAKELRAEAAVRCGADLVLELPVNCVLRSAEGFAAGGVDILNRLGFCDHLAFGCEDPRMLLQTAEAMRTPAFQKMLPEKLAEGLSYPAACQAALEAAGEDGTFLAKPNNILAVSYCLALEHSGSTMRPLPILRNGSYHASVPQAEHPSAESLRASGLLHGYVPEAAEQIFTGAPEYRLEYGDRAVLARLRCISPEESMLLPFASEGLWNRLLREACRCMTAEQVLQASKSKRYPYTRLSRMLLCGYLGITNEVLRQKPPYVRILAFDEKGRGLLNRAKKNTALTLVRPGEREPDAAFSAMEKRCGYLFELFRKPGMENERKKQLFYLHGQSNGR